MEWDLGNDKRRDDMIIETMDVSKDLFSMKEVMELTLLHAQQMNMLQTEYE